MKELLDRAIEILHHKGADYGEIRIGFYKSQSITTRNVIVTGIANNSSEGVGVRAFFNGGWGFASSTGLSREEIDCVVHRAIEIAKASALSQSQQKFAHEPSHSIIWRTPYQIDPFSVAISDKVEFQLQVNREMLKNPEIKQTAFYMNFAKEHKFFQNTQGTSTDQFLMRVDARCNAMATGREGFETRYFEALPLNIGYEHILSTPFLREAPRVAEEAVQKLHAPQCPCETADLILLPSHTALTIHETIGHATELDRVMGWEADMAGTSFATIEKMNSLQYASPIINVIADRDMLHGRATVPVDDEGVQTGRWYIIKNGILSGYSTTRCTAHFINEQQSRGCSFADSWRSIPILRMPNLSIEPSIHTKLSLNQLIDDTPNGILVDGMGSFSIDHQRIHFQFGGDCAWRLRNGKKSELLRNFTYQSSNPQFWNSVDAICDESEWQPYGVVNCGKGQPMQRAQLTHASPPLRLRNVSIGKAKI